MNIPDATIITFLFAMMWAITLWLAYRWGRHVENPCFWESERRAGELKTPDKDPRTRDR